MDTDTVPVPLSASAKHSLNIEFEVVMELKSQLFIVKLAVPSLAHAKNMYLVFVHPDIFQSDKSNATLPNSGQLWNIPCAEPVISNREVINPIPVKDEQP